MGIKVGIKVCICESHGVVWRMFFVIIKKTFSTIVNSFVWSNVIELKFCFHFFVWIGKLYNMWDWFDLILIFGRWVLTTPKQRPCTHWLEYSPYPQPFLYYTQGGTMVNLLRAVLPTSRPKLNLISIRFCCKEFQLPKWSTKKHTGGKF